MAQDDRRRVYMYFQFRSGWRSQFLEADLQTPPPCRLHFTSSEKAMELVERGDGIKPQTPVAVGLYFREQSLAYFRHKLICPPNGDWSYNERCPTHSEYRRSSR